MSGVAETLISDVSVFVENYRTLERRCAELERSQFNADKFYAVSLPVCIVAKLHGVSEYLVRKYVRLGLIPAHPASTDAKILVRGSDALLLDFNDLRSRASANESKLSSAK